MIEKNNRPEKAINHPEEVIDHCIDNHLTFAESYVAIIGKKIEKLDRDLHILRCDIEELYAKCS